MSILDTEWGICLPLMQVQVNASNHNPHLPVMHTDAGILGAVFVALDAEPLLP